MHPCNIRSYTYSEFQKDFGSRGLPSLYHEPIIILNSTKRFHDVKSKSSKKEVNHVKYANNNNNNEHNDMIQPKNNNNNLNLNNRKYWLDIYPTI